MIPYAIVGGKDFNNYYLAANFFKFLTPSRIRVVTTGIEGTGYIAERYAEFNGMPFERYPDSQQLIVDVSERMIAFHNGQLEEVKSSIQLMLQKGGGISIIIYTDSDILKSHKNVVHCKKDKFDVYIGRGKKTLGKWGSPYPLKDEKERMRVVHRYTDFCMKQNKFKDIEELRNKILGCWCSPKLCHGDVLVWILENKGTWPNYPRFELVPQDPSIDPKAKIQFYWKGGFDVHEYIQRLGIDTTKYKSYKIIS